MDLRRRQTHRVVVGTMRGALGTLGDVPAGQPVLQLGFGVHRRTWLLSWGVLWAPGPSAAIPPREFACGHSSRPAAIRSG
jgi:hypothetical protein